MNIGDTD